MKFRIVKGILLVVLVILVAAALSSAHAQQLWTFTPLYPFKGGADGYMPSFGSMIMDSAGNLYGTTILGGPNSAGVVFEVTPSTKGEKVLYPFTGGADGGNPYGGLIMDSAGNLYGTTEIGGANFLGTVFELPLGASQPTILYNFCSLPGCSDGAAPKAALIRDAKGNFYGTTNAGGETSCDPSGPGCGVVFKLSPTGQETVLHTFTGSPLGGPDGEFPYSPLIRDSKGNLYGTTYAGGPDDAGTVYEVPAVGMETVLHAFSVSDGEFPYYGGLLRAPNGTLYGTTYAGGNGYGVIFALAPNGHVTTVNFDGADGSEPFTSVIAGSSSIGYGTTPYGGTNGYGTVYQVTAAGKETVIYNFANGADGEYPYGGLVMDAQGNLYGTTQDGGAGGGGVVFELSPP